MAFDKANEADLKLFEAREMAKLNARLEKKGTSLSKINDDGSSTLTKDSAGKLASTPAPEIEKAFYKSIKTQAYMADKGERAQKTEIANYHLNRINTELAGLTGEPLVQHSDKKGLSPLPQDAVPNMTPVEIQNLRESTKTLFMINQELGALQETLSEMKTSSFGTRADTDDTLTSEHFKNMLIKKLDNLDPAKPEGDKLSKSKRALVVGTIEAIDQMTPAELEEFSKQLDTRVSDQFAANGINLKSLDPERQTGEVTRRMYQTYIAIEEPIIDREFTKKQIDEIPLIKESERATARANTRVTLDKIELQLSPFKANEPQKAEDLVPLPRDAGQKPKVVAPEPRPFFDDLLPPEDAPSPNMTEEEARKRFNEELMIPENDEGKAVPKEKPNPSSRELKDLRLNPRFQIPSFEHEPGKNPLFTPPETIKGTSTDKPMSDKEALAEFRQMVQPGTDTGGIPLVASNKTVGPKIRDMG
jgi:hypothetical protein